MPVSVLRGVVGRLVVGMAVAGLWAAPPVLAQDAGRLTLIPAPGMAALAKSQERITRLLGEARAELALAPQALRGNRDLGPVRTSIETVAFRSRTLSESFSAVAVAEGLAIPVAAFCAKVAGASVAEEDRVAVLLARHQLEAMTQAMALFGLEQTHGAVEALLSGLDADSRGKRRHAESRQSLNVARQRLAQAMDLYSHRVLAPFADALSKVPGNVTDPNLADRICAPPAAPSAPPASLPSSATEVAAADGIRRRTEAASDALRKALEVVRAATDPPADVEIPRFITGEVVRPRKIRDLAPSYTARALAACIGGSVILQAVITKAGTIEDISVLKPLPGLTEAAVAALSRWKFEPARLHGQPVEVYYNVTISFSPPARRCTGRVSRPWNPWQ